MSKFYLVQLTEAGEKPMQEAGLFETGPEAARKAKELTLFTGIKVQPRRITDANDWRTQIAEMLKDTKGYKPMPKGWDLEPIPDHFAHLPAIDLTKIGFIEDDSKGVIQRFTYLTPGRYLERYYKHLDQETRKKYIALIDKSGILSFAKTPEEIEKIYLDNGISSCMTGWRDNWKDFGHPVRAYGAGDLAVAYLTNSAGKLAARCVCWPEKKEYGRLYGDARLSVLLMEEGYKQVSTFVGAKLLKFQTKRDGEYVMPYFDNIAVAIDNGDHFLTAQQYKNGQSYKGSGIGFMHQWCPKLKGYDTSNNFVKVHGEKEMWSRKAANKYAALCSGTGEYWDKAQLIEMYDGTFWSKDYMSQHGFVCDGTKQGYPKTHLIERDGKNYSRNYIRTLALREAYEAAKKSSESVAA